MSYTLHHGDCLDVMRGMPAASVDAVVTDPPYELGFMNKGWDATGVAYRVEVWAEALRVLKPGGHMLAFGGSRTYHRLACAIEDAGFEVRDQIMWVYGSGFPKSLDVSKAIDKAAGAEREVVGVRWNRTANEVYGAGKGTNTQTLETLPATTVARQWAGWGTSLKPAHEPICVARKPLIGTVAANVQEHGTGALNIDGCRISVGSDDEIHAKHPHTKGGFGHANAHVYGKSGGSLEYDTSKGRWPANLCHDGSDEVMEAFAAFGEKKSGAHPGNRKGIGYMGGGKGTIGAGRQCANSGTVARFFYAAKTSRAERGEGNVHPTVKPQALMRWLCRLITPPGGLVLDPFAGSGSTLLAALAEGFEAVGIERDPGYLAIASKRLAEANDALPLLVGSA